MLFRISLRLAISIYYKVLTTANIANFPLSRKVLTLNSENSSGNGLYGRLFNYYKCTHARGLAEKPHTPPLLMPFSQFLACERPFKPLFRTEIGAFFPYCPKDPIATKEDMEKMVKYIVEQGKNFK